MEKTSDSPALDGNLRPSSFLATGMILSTVLIQSMQKEFPR